MPAHGDGCSVHSEYWLIMEINMVEEQQQCSINGGHAIPCLGPIPGWSDGQTAEARDQGQGREDRREADDATGREA